jgi:hypothetical protein
MRILTKDELTHVLGAEHTVVNINTTNADVRVVPLDNGTVNIDITVMGITTTWNSGVAVTCKTFGLGAGLMSLAFTSGSSIGFSLVAAASGIGCSAAVSYTGNVPPSPTDDGDP